MSILPVVLFDDLEAWAVSTMQAALDARDEPFADGVIVATKVPNPRTDRMVIIRRDGGPRLDVAREAARFGVNVWATTDIAASNLARLVAALLWASPDGDPVCKVTQKLGPSYIEDPSKQPRIYMTFEFIARGRDDS